MSSGLRQKCQNVSANSPTRTTKQATGRVFAIPFGKMLAPASFLEPRCLFARARPKPKVNKPLQSGAWLTNWMRDRLRASRLE